MQIEGNGKLFQGDNLEILRGFDDEIVDLIYLDPPFNSNKNYATFKDKWTLDDIDGINREFLVFTYPDLDKIIDVAGITHGSNLQAYLIMMSLRLIELKRILKSTGSIYLHCDPSASHYLKILMDCLFGRESFLNEIVWYYRRWNIASRMFARNHDILLLYVKDKNDHQFNQMYIPKSKKSSLQGESWKSVIGSDGVRRSIKTGEPTKGVPMPDVWDLSIINPVAKERTGYPTQKPEALLDRVIKASSNEGDLVLDPFAGSGTALVAAERLRRRWIGIDIWDEFEDFVKQRLKLNKNIQKEWYED